METFLTIFGYLFVIVAGCIAIFQSARNKINASSALAIGIIGLLIGIFIVPGNRITEITTLGGSIKIAEKEATAAAVEAKNIVKNMEELKASIEQSRNNAERQTDEIKKIKQETVKDREIILSDLQKIKKEAPTLIKIMFNKESIKTKENNLAKNSSFIESNKNIAINNSNTNPDNKALEKIIVEKKLDQFEEDNKTLEKKINDLKKETDELRKQLTILQE